MDKEFISFEQAKVLKELGFDETCFMYWKYEPDGKAYKYYFSEPNVENEVGSNNSDEATFVVCTAPLWQQAFRFFRENYKLGSTVSHVNVQAVHEDGYDYHIYGEYDSDFAYDIDSEKFSTFEEAQSACLDKLIELAKEIK